jgi:anti-sigma B factor antagonist
MALTIHEAYDEGGNRWRFNLAGEIDISNAHQLQQKLESAYQTRPADLCLDLGGLGYIDSTGLGVIIAVYGNIKKNGHKMVVVNPRDNVKKLLRVSRLDKVLLEA